MIPYVPITCGTCLPHVVYDRPVKDIEISNFKPLKPMELLQDFKPTLTWTMREGLLCPFFPLRQNFIPETRVRKCSTILVKHQHFPFIYALSTFTLSEPFISTFWFRFI